MIAGFASFLTDTLVWTGVLIALVLVLRRPVARLFGPGMSYALWLLPLLRFALPPIPLPAAFAPAAADSVPAVAGAEVVTITVAAPAAPEFVVPWALLLTTAWLLGAVLFLVARWLEYKAMRQRLLSGAVEVDRREGVRIVETPAVDAPVALGVRDKVIALPPRFLITGSLAERALAIEHELSHHRGRDLIANIAALQQNAANDVVELLHNIRQLRKIIANPNCSTIQMVVVLKPLHEKYQIKRVVVSTYQSVTGTGKAAVDQLFAERNGDDSVSKVYPHPIDLNVLPHIDVFLENGYTKEEMKMVKETTKIMGDDSIRVTATTVRIPTIGGHSEAVNIEFARDFDVQEVRELLRNAEGVIVQDDPANKIYPMPLTAHGKDEVFVGRIRRDESQPNTLNLWIVADNLRKGAATNAVQIAEYLVKHELVGEAAAVA